MQNAGLDEAQAGLKFAERNINNLRYADDTTLIAESECQTLFFWAPKSVQMVTAAMKLKQWNLVRRKLVF